MSRARAVVLCVAVLAAGCVRDGGGDDGAATDDLRPAFPAVTAPSTGGEPSASTVTSGAGASAGTTPLPASTAVPAGTAPGAPPVTAAPVTATITDPVGDATPSVVDRPPAWSDLAGGTLIRTAGGFELRVKLGGGRAPTATDDEHTMNVASFYDVDGDGGIDYEVWANISSGGWGGSWFDNNAGTARYNDEAGVTWTAEGDSIVMRFPLAHLGNATRFRWSLASEWGRYEVLSTPASVRDDAPDDNRPASFNG